MISNGVRRLLRDLKRVAEVTESDGSAEAGFSLHFSAGVRHWSAYEHATVFCDAALPLRLCIVSSPYASTEIAT